jgi:methyltransferase (TIGR00027 family)
MAAARYRLAHMLLDDAPRVYEDPLLERCLGEDIRRGVLDAAQALRTPKALTDRGTMVVRQRFAEDVLAEAANDGVGQFVILGAGMDLFGVRGGALRSRLTVFELDRADMQRFKRRRLAEAGLVVPSSLRFVPHDLATAGMIGALRRAGLDPGRRALVAWMGCTQYLTREAIAATLGETAAALSPGSGIVFDYKQLVGDLDPDDAAALEAYLRPGVREPWLSIFAEGELPALLAAAGWTVVRDIGSQEVMAGYLADRKDGLRFPGYTRLVYARNEGRGKG